MFSTSRLDLPYLKQWGIEVTDLWELGMSFEESKRLLLCTLSSPDQLTHVHAP